jgi:hypothetical protein
MNKTRCLTTMFAGGLLVFSLALGSAQARPIVYPAKGQDQAQQNKDEGECHQWAVKNTGVDPAQLAAETSSGEVYTRQHAELGGAARGGLLGLGIGAIAGDAGKGAGIGALVGAVGGRMRERRSLDMQHQVTENAHASQQAQLQEYDRAYSACLSGRGYTVN